MAIRSEDDILVLLDRHFPTAHPSFVLGRGDDCAVVKVPSEVMVTTDLFLEDEHFRRAYFGPGDIGYKGLAVNVSDILGMGGAPLGFSLGLSLPPDVGEAFLEELFAGMAGLAARYDLPLTGGDLTRASRLVVCVTVWGAPPPGGRVLPRRRTEPGDTLFSVGPLGLTRLGLTLLEAEGLAAKARYPAAVAAHLRPTLHPEAAWALSRLPGVRGMMDVSDGLARDLPRFVRPGQGAAVALAAGDFHPELLSGAPALGLDPAATVYLGGEDYALLAACAPGYFDTVRAAVPGAYAIGAVTADGDFTLNGRERPGAGFDHFAAGEGEAG